MRVNLEHQMERFLDSFGFISCVHLGRKWRLGGPSVCVTVKRTNRVCFCWINQVEATLAVK